MSRHRSSDLPLIVGILLIAFNLRPSLASLGPLIPDIIEDLGVSGTLMGLVSTLPLPAFAVVSMFTPVFTKRYGFGKTLLGALALLTLGIVLRSLFGLPGLVSGTLMLGTAIAFGNVLIPALTRQNFPRRAGLITALYSSVMGVGAALAAGVTVPLVASGWTGWRGALGVWALPAGLALVFWSTQYRNIRKSNPRRGFREAMAKLSGKRLVWTLALYLGLQSFAFYVILAWLPAMLVTTDYDSVFAGWMLSLSQFTGILGTLVIPLWAGRRKDQRTVVTVLIAMELVGLVGLMFPQIGAPYVWISILGFALGGTFALALLLIVVRSDDAETAAELSAIVQSIGYLVAAPGPILAGWIFDRTNAWGVVLLILVGLSLAKWTMGLHAGRNRKV